MQNERSRWMRIIQHQVGEMSVAWSPNCQHSCLSLFADKFGKQDFQWARYEYGATGET